MKLRSLLFVPADSEHKFAKASGIGADALILDLEDSVAPGAKAEARAKVAAAVRSQAYGSRELVIRVNAIDTPWGADDLKAAAEAKPHAVLLPKVSRPDDVVNATRIYGEAGGGGETRFWAMIETPLSIFNVRDIASAHVSANLSCLILGTNDLLKESRASAAGG